MGEREVARVGQPKQIRPMTIPKWEAAFPDDDACATYLVAHRRPDGAFCPRWVYGASIFKAWHWQCDKWESRSTVSLFWSAQSSRTLISHSASGSA